MKEMLKRLMILLIGLPRKGTFTDRLLNFHKNEEYDEENKGIQFYKDELIQFQNGYFKVIKMLQKKSSDFPNRGHASDYIEVIKELIFTLQSLTERLETEFDINLKYSDLSKSTRPHLEGLSTKMISEVTLSNSRDFILAKNKYCDINGKEDYQDDFKRLILSSNYDNPISDIKGIVSPLVVIKKLVADLLTVFDYYMDKVNAKRIDDLAELLIPNTQGMYIAFPVQIITLYNFLGYPLPKSFKGNNEIQFGSRGAAFRYTKAFIKETVPFVLGKTELDFTNHWTIYVDEGVNLGDSNLREFF